MRTLIALSLALAASSPAHALSCMDWEVQGTLPADGAAAVPTNARVAVQIYSWSDDLADPVLQDADGNAVSTTVTSHDAGSETTFFLTPDAPLEAGQYSVIVERGWDGVPETATTFTVGEGEDLVAPSQPLVVDVRGDHDTDEWGDWDDLTVETADEVLDDNGVIYELTITDKRSGDSFVRYSLAPTATLTDNPCSDDDAALIRANQANVDVRALDVAGNASSPDIWVCGTGCSVTGGAPIGGLFALLPLVALRRRKNRK